MSRTKLVPTMKPRDAPLGIPVEALSMIGERRQSKVSNGMPGLLPRPWISPSARPYNIPSTRTAYVWTASEAGYVSICTYDSMPIEFCQWISIPCCRGEQIPFARANTMIKAGKLPRNHKVKDWCLFCPWTDLFAGCRSPYAILLVIMQPGKTDREDSLLGCSDRRCPLTSFRISR